VHKDKIAELAHEDSQVTDEREQNFRSWEQKTKEAFRQTREIMKLNGISFTEAAKIVGLIKED